MVGRSSLPPGYFTSLEGTFQAQEEASTTIAALSMVSLAMIFLVLYSRYRPAVLTLIIMGNVPRALIGSVAALWIAGQPLSVASMIGFITLTGISTRSLSTLADQVGAAAAVLKPLHDLIAAHVMAAGRLHGDDTPVPVLATGKTDTGRLWVYVRDDRPFAGQAPPAALLHYSRDRKGEHPERHLAGFTGWLQADAFAGYNRLYEPDHQPGPISDALCWAHARRGFFKLADIAANTSGRPLCTA